jgi:hypothetical protein
LVAGASCTWDEQRSWVTAKQLLEEAWTNGEDVAIVFAEADKTADLVAWAILTGVELTPQGTRYSFVGLKALPEPRPCKSTLRKRGGAPHSDDFIRPYAICLTPDFLRDAWGTH